MNGETNLERLIKGMTPVLNEGEYVFVTVKSVEKISKQEIVCEFKEKEGISVILKKETADKLNLSYSFVSAWITLEIPSSLSAVGLTAAFSTELAKHDISCNVIAGYYHDHIFVDVKGKNKAVRVLKELSESY
ncbi:MAG: ACT domain-containing protein [Ignavibacteria bacterium]|jgi:hypothetical protein